MSIPRYLLSDFVEIQRKSFFQLLEKGLIEEFNKRNPIKNSKKNLEIFFYPEYYKLTIPENSPRNSILKSKSYTSKLYIPVQLTDKFLRISKLKWVCIGSLPLMTKRGHFILNGAPRVIVNQILRSPGIYFQKKIYERFRTKWDYKPEISYKRYYADLICQRGTWLRIEMDKEKTFWAQMKKGPKIPLFWFLLGIGLTEKIIFNTISEPWRIRANLEREETLIKILQEIYKLYEKKNEGLLKATELREEANTLIRSRINKMVIYPYVKNPPEAWIQLHLLVTRGPDHLNIRKNPITQKVFLEFLETQKKKTSLPFQISIPFENFIKTIILNLLSEKNSYGKKSESKKFSDGNKKKGFETWIIKQKTIEQSPINSSLSPGTPLVISKVERTPLPLSTLPQRGLGSPSIFTLGKGNRAVEGKTWTGQDRDSIFPKTKQKALFPLFPKGDSRGSSPQGSFPRGDKRTKWTPSSPKGDKIGSKVEQDQQTSTIAIGPSQSKKKKNRININKKKLSAPKLLLAENNPILQEFGRKWLFNKFMNPRNYDLGKLGRLNFNRKLGISIATDNCTLTAQDLVYTADYLIKVQQGFKKIDDIDHLKNRRVRTSGELLQIQIGTGLIRLEKEIREKLNNIESLPDSTTKFKTILKNNSKSFFEMSFKLSDTNDSNDLSPEKMINSSISGISKDYSYPPQFNNFSKSVSSKKNLYNIGIKSKLKSQSKNKIDFNKNVITLTNKHKKIIFNEISKTNKFSVTQFINTIPLNSSLREFFGSSPLSQFMDQINPLSELTHKRRLSSMGPGGVTRDSATLAIRGIHPTHYGRICPVETPEGKNTGLVNSMTALARVTAEGFLQSPFYKVYKGQVQKRAGMFFFSADQEEKIKLAAADLSISPAGFLPHANIPVRMGEDFTKIQRTNVEYIGVSAIQMISIATSLIPFLEHDDANRALMGSNMQRQAIPLLRPERPIVGTGLEARAVSDSGHVLQAKYSGFVRYASGNKILIYSFS